MVKRSLAKAVTGYWPISERVMMMKMDAKPFKLVLIQVYAPTTDYSEEEVDMFYQEVEEAIAVAKTTDMVFVLGDLNAKVGRGKEEKTVGPHGLGIRNERGERLVNFCKEHNLIVTNTYYQHGNRRLYTWKSPGDTCRNQIDYIMVKQRFRNSVKDVRTYPGADMNSDHCLLVARVRLKIKIPKKSERKEQLDLDCLKEKKVRDRFAAEVKNRFNTLIREETEQNDQEDVEELWQDVKDSLTGAAKSVLPKRKKKPKNDWITGEITDLMEKRRQCKNRKEEQYKRLDKEIKRKCKGAKDNWLNGLCDEIEELGKRHMDGEMHKKIKEMTNRKHGIKTNSGCVNDADGKLLTDKDQITERWREYVSLLYSDDNRRGCEGLNATEGPEILKEEVTAAIKRIKNGKAPGIDEITGEMLKALDEEGIDIITNLIRLMYDTGKLPKDLRHSIFVKIPKKHNAVDCSDYRTLAIMSHVTKVLLRVILNRNETTFDREISDSQSGFRSGMGTREAIFNLRNLCEKSLEVNQDVYICFIDYQKAFDRVFHQNLIDMLKNTEMDSKDICILQNLYWNQRAVVRMDDSFTDEFDIKRGVRQGCILSPKLFNLYSEEVFKDLDHLEGIVIGGRNINNIRYADDTALIANSEEGLQMIVDEVNERSKSLGLYMNVTKTKVMLMHKKEEDKKVTILVGGKELKQVKSYLYLGQMVTSDGRCDTEIKRRIGIAKSSFGKMKDALTSRRLNLSTRKRLLHCYVMSTLLYGCETWTISKQMEDRLGAFELWAYRKLLRISYLEHRTNEWVLNKVGEERSLLRTIKTKKCSYFGHIIRAGKIQRHIVEGKINGRRGRGRPRRSWLRNIAEWTGLRMAAITQAAKDRRRWRFMVGQALRSMPP